MLMRIKDVIARSRQTLEDEAISPSEIEWTGLIDAENYLIGIKGMKAGSNEACYYKIEHGMVMCEQPTYQTERPIRPIDLPLSQVIFLKLILSSLSCKFSYMRA